MVSKLDGQEKLSEIPAIQKRRVAQPLADFESMAPNRNSAIAAAYASGAYNLKEIADHFGLHSSSVSRIVRSARCKTSYLESASSNQDASSDEAARSAEADET